MSEWIPSAERLPEFGVDVLVWTPGGAEVGQMAFLKRCGEDAPWEPEWRMLRQYANDLYGCRPISVRAWQYLPEDFAPLWWKR